MTQGPPQETEEAIVTATYRAFCEHGYANLTMRKIAAEFSKSRSLIHYHYDTKEELLGVLLESLVERYAAELSPPDGDPVAALEQFVDDSLFGSDAALPGDEAFEYEEFHAALFELRAQAHRNDEFREQLAASHRVIRDALADSVRRGVERGAFREVEPTAYAELLMDAVDGARTRALTQGKLGARERASENVRRHLLDALRRTG